MDPIRIEELDPFVVVEFVGNDVNVDIYHHTGDVFMFVMSPVAYAQFVRNNDEADKCRATTMPEQHKRSITGRTIDPR